MSKLPPVPFNPETDLKLERVVDVPVELVWKAWTTPELIKQWFCPRPWSVSEVTLELRPGGAFNSTFQSPEGKAFPNEGCVLEVHPNQRFVWTDALVGGFRPSAKGYASKGEQWSLTAVIDLQPEGKGTRYTAYALHNSAEASKKHEAMGFHEGWGTALEQLVELCKGMR
jgi:uncharacterized protein YndB with AHSA1/START domain